MNSNFGYHVHSQAKGRKMNLKCKKLASERMICQFFRPRPFVKKQQDFNVSDYHILQIRRL